LPGPQVTENEWNDCLAAVSKIYGIAYIVISGSLPAGLPNDIFRRLAHIARKKNARLVVDTSGKPLGDAVQAGAYLVKPNLTELAMLTGSGELTASTAGNAARELLRNSGCSVIVVSLGALGAILVTEKTAIEIKPPALEVVSTVGAGDSLVAGLVYWLSLGKSLLEATRFGVACGSAATLNPGSELCKKTDADNIYQTMQRVAELA
jgi:6-phosphofructokinase 2